MFQHHVFISYSHLDNSPIEEGGKGWICSFHCTLYKFLSRRLGEPARIWRDKKLHGNDIFAEHIIQACRNSTLFFMILTPRYVRSEWCLKEAQEFIQHADSNDGLAFENKSRIFKVIKTPLKAHDSCKSLPDAANKILGYEFFESDGEVPMEFDPVLGQEYKEKFLQKIHRLAYYAAETINLATSDPCIVSDHNKIVIFLASCGNDIQDVRERLRSELISLGYRVLPEETLPEDESNHREAIAKLLKEADFSIHLIGSNYGKVLNSPDPDGLSQIELQYNMAEEHFRALLRDMKKKRHNSAESKPCLRLIWLPESTGSLEVKQQEFRERLLNGPESQQSADLLTGSFEDFRTELIQRLTLLEKDPPQLPCSEKAGRTTESEATGQVHDSHAANRVLFLSCIRDDLEATSQLSEWLEAQSWEVRLPSFPDQSSTFRKERERTLSECRAAVIFYGHGDKEWQRCQENDLRRALAYRSGKTLPFLTYLALPNNDHKAHILNKESSHYVEDGRQGFCSERLQSFLQNL